MRTIFILMLSVFLFVGCTTGKKNESLEKLKKQLEMKETLAERNKELVRTFFKLLEEENIPAFINLFAENGKQINPYASRLFPSGAEGKEELTKYWEPLPDNFDGMEFPIQEIYAMEDPNMVYVKYKGKIQLKNNAGLYENQYYSTFTFDENGKILKYVEIFNPITAAKGFGMLDQIE